jgi:hypothetical protein
MRPTHYLSLFGAYDGLKHYQNLPINGWPVSKEKMQMQWNRGSMWLIATALMAISHTAPGQVAMRPLTSEAITEAEIRTPGFTENISGDSIWVVIDVDLAVGDRIELELDNGASFSSPTLTIEQSLGGAGTGLNNFATLSPSPATDASRITFNVTAPVTLTPQGAPPFANNNGVILSGDAINGQAIDFAFSQVWTGREVNITATLYDSGDNLVGSDSVKLFDLPAPPPIPVPVSSA